MSKTLSAGETIKLSSLDKVIKALHVGVNWQLLPDLKNPPEGDIFAFLIGKNGKTPSNEDFVFYNQPDGVNGNVQLHASDVTADNEGGSQTIELALHDMRYEIVSVIVGFNLYRAGERDQSFRFLQSCEVTLSDGGKKPLASFAIDPKAHRDAICMSLLRLDRDGNDWAVTPLEEESPCFDAIARQYGIIVAGG